MKKIICALLTLTLAAALFAACGKNDAQPTTDPAGETESVAETEENGETADAEETKDGEETEAAENNDAQADEVATDADGKSAKDYAGVYGLGRCTITVTHVKDNDLQVEVTWGSSAAETTVWTMSGTYNPDKFTLTYGDAVKTNHVFDAEGNDKATVAYENGLGRFIFTDGKLTWQDEEEQIANGSEFIRSEAN